MPIVFRCQICNQKLSAPSRKAGTEISCPACKNKLTVPDPDAAENVVEADPVPESEALDELEELPEEEELVEGGQPGPASHQSALQGEDSEDDGQGDEDESLEFRKAESDFDDMDLTPMVDVTFLLLIFFMITASFSIQKTIQVPSPDPEQEGAVVQPSKEDVEKVSIEVVIDEKNTITVDDEPLADPSGIVDAIQSKMRSESKGELLLSADVESLHETWVLVIDAATEAGIQKVRTVTTGE